MARRLFPDTLTFLCRMEIDHLADVCQSQSQSQNFDLHAIEKLFDVFHHCDELAIALGAHQHASGYSSSQNRQKNCMCRPVTWFRHTHVNRSVVASKL
jgi:hypothetical protein